MEVVNNNYCQANDLLYPKFSIYGVHNIEETALFYFKNISTNIVMGVSVEWEAGSSAELVNSVLRQDR